MLHRLLFFISFSSLLQVSSQSSVGEISIKGLCFDSITRKPLALTTISVYNKRDTSLLTYRLSNDKGSFEFILKGIDKNLYYIFFNHEGYRPKRIYLSNTNNSILNIGLEPISKSLGEVVVFSEKLPIQFRKDTIEFNANSFKTLPTALVEDLLKKLPGVDIDRDGNISVNGKAVNRILIDGREFFGNNVKLATRNLPANIIDKINVYPDSEEIDANPLKSKALIGQVINLKFKKEIKAGYFGKLFAGFGDGGRYELGGLSNHFRDTLQVSIIGFSNNLNKGSFGLSDLRSLGGFDRSGIGSISTNNNGISVNGISFGGTGEGIQKASGTGFNLNNIFRNKVTFNLQYFFGNTLNDIKETSIRTQSIDTSMFSISAKRNDLIKAFSHRIGSTLKFNIDSFTKFDFRPGVTFTEQNNSKESFSKSEIFNSNLNTSANNSIISSNSIAYRHIINLQRTKNRKKPFGFYQIFNYDKFNSGNNFNVINDFNIKLDSISQNRYRGQESLTLNNQLTWDFIHSAKNRSRLYFQSIYNTGYDNVNSYDLLSSYILIDSLTNRLRRNSLKNNISYIFNKSLGDVAFSLTATISHLSINNFFRSGISLLKQNFINLFPGFGVTYKGLQFDYSVSLSPPAINDLQTAPDFTNPIFIVLGNTALKPTLTHNIYLNAYQGFGSNKYFFNGYFNGNINRDAIVRVRYLDTSGIQYSIPLNVDRTFTFFSLASVNRQIKFSKNIKASFTTGFSLNFTNSYLEINKIGSRYSLFDLSYYLRSNINFKDKFEFSLNVRQDHSNNYFINNYYKNVLVRRLGVNSEVILRPNNFLTFETNIDFRTFPTGESSRDNLLVINPALTMSVDKTQKTFLKFSINDLLNRNRNIFSSTNENIFSFRTINALQRFYMITLSYNIRDFREKKIGGKQPLFLF